MICITCAGSNLCPEPDAANPRQADAVLAVFSQATHPPNMIMTMPIKEGTAILIALGNRTKESK